MVEWFKSHVFLAAWASPIIALIGLILKKSDPTNPVNWSKVMIYVGFLTSLAIMVTPDMNTDAKSTAHLLVATGMGYLIVESMMGRK